MINSNYGKSWEYINLHDYEFKVRQQEREAEFERRCEERRRHRIKAVRRIKAQIIDIPVKIMGIILIFTTIQMLNIETDGTFALVTIPLGLLACFCPAKMFEVFVEDNEKTGRINNKMLNLLDKIS